MAELTEEDGEKIAECVSLQKQFLVAFNRYLEDSARINNLDLRVTELKKEHDEFRAELMGFMTMLKPVHDAYLRGMTLKSKAGTLAICYIVLMALFPQLSPSHILSIVKMLL